jgi:hypothetical protein
VREVFGILYRPGTPKRTVDEMDEAIARHMRSRHWRQTNKADE